MMYWIVFALFQAVEVVTDTFIPWLEMMWGGGEGKEGDERKGEKGRQGWGGGVLIAQLRLDPPTPIAESGWTP